MVSPGLRERKKERTRRHIADTAARLFAEHGYEQVAVTDVARAAEVAEVAEQTVYNYFPTKEHLVTDREGQIQDRLSELIRSRPPGITPATAIRNFVLTSVAGIRDIPPELWRGELGYLAVISPAVHRLALELTDRLAAALAAVISDTTAVPPEIARLQGTALASVFQFIISESGRRTREGQTVRQRVEEVAGRGEQAPAGHIPFTPQAKEVLKLALQEARALGHHYIGTEHILLGLIRAGDGVAAQVLTELGADLNGAREQVIRLLDEYRREHGYRGG